jgi:hypothetical protein
MLFIAINDYAQQAAASKNFEMGEEKEGRAR